MSVSIFREHVYSFRCDLFFLYALFLLTKTTPDAPVYVPPGYYAREAVSVLDLDLFLRKPSHVNNHTHTHTHVTYLQTDLGANDTWTCGFLAFHINLRYNSSF